MEKTGAILEFEKPLRALEEQLSSLQNASQEQHIDVAGEIAAIEEKLEKTKRDIYLNLTAWQRVQIARHPQRPYALDYIKRLFTHFDELHGDRLFGDDQAIIGGPAEFDGKPVMIIAQQKGRDTRENLRRNFGMPHPEGYRKALRLMRMAAKFDLPVISLIDTAGAFPGIGSEERHVSEAIAVNLREMSRLPVPIIAAVIGEGGSGGALGIGVANRVLILANAYYSVISPEGCAAILWKDRAHAPKAAEALKLTADDLLKARIVDEIVAEPLGGAHREPENAAENLRTALQKNLNRLRRQGKQAVIDQRYRRFRDLGVYAEEVSRKVEAAGASA